jgi:hypothetical protein
MPQGNIGFHSESARTRGKVVTTTFTVTGGEIDTSLLDQLTDVTLTHVEGSTYQLTTQADTFHERTVRNTQVYNALLRYYEGNRRPLEQLIEADARG